MTEKQNKTLATLRSLLPLFLITIAISALMVGVFAVIGRLDRTVIIGTLLGTAAAILNFIAMTISLLRAEKSDAPAKAALKVRGFYLLRMVLLIAILVLALRSGLFNPFATLLPLCFPRIAMFAKELLFRKKRKGGA